MSEDGTVDIVSSVKETKPVSKSFKTTKVDLYETYMLADAVTTAGTFNLYGVYLSWPDPITLKEKHSLPESHNIVVMTLPEPMLAGALEVNNPIIRASHEGKKGTIQLISPGLAKTASEYREILSHNEGVLAEHFSTMEVTSKFFDIEEWYALPKEL